MAWTTPRTWTDGELVNAAIMNPHVRDQLNVVPHMLAKTADQSVTSSTALIDDTHLQFSIGANEGWAFRFVLGNTAGSPGLLKVALNAPAGATGFWTSLCSVGAGSLESRGRYVPATFVDGETVSSATAPDVHYIDGYVLNSVTGGTVKLRWAQVSSSGTATVLKRGSTLQRIKIA